MLKSERYADKIKRDDIPVDDSLPGLSVLLVPENVGSILADLLPESVGVVKECRILYIRYKPGTNCIVAYQLQLEKDGEPKEILFYAKLYTEDDYENATRKAASSRWIPIPDLEPYITLPEHATILYFYPNDCLIDGLRILSDLKKIQRILYENYDQYPEDKWRISNRQISLSTVRYKPERRVVLRCRARAKNRETSKWVWLKLYIRVYADDRGAALFSLQEKIHKLSEDSGLFTSPRPLTYLPERKALIMEKARGKQFLESIEGDNRAANISKTAIALAAMHGFDIPGLSEKSRASYIDDAEETRRMLTKILPIEAKLADTIFDELKNHSLAADKPGFVHGDFYYGQVLCRTRKVSILDFDRSHRGDTVFDIGNFLAHIKLLRLRGELDGEKDIETIFLKTYKEIKDIEMSNLNFWIAFGLYQLAVGPFRRLEPNWKEGITTILAECKKILES
ncbi:MAG: phosphotransferase [candidate division Zixibacteria bacterium]